MEDKVKRYYCNEEHLNGKMYHYSDEVIYEKHLIDDAKIETKDELGNYN